jgi:4-amino-4-deoxy-L-arabinose transferase-like glycosyltransferase
MTLQENEKNGNLPPRDILLVARGTSVIFGISCCILAFLIGFFFRNTWVGLLSAGLLISNKLFIVLATSAMPDIFFIFFILSACLFIILLTRFPQKKYLVPISGFFAGLAASVKIHGIVIVSLLFFAYLIYRALINKKRTIFNIMLYAVIFSFSALTVVYILNPYFWPSFKEIKRGAIKQELKSFYELAIREKTPKQTLGYLYKIASNGGFQVEDTQRHFSQLRILIRPLNFPFMFKKWIDMLYSREESTKTFAGENRLIVLHRTLLLRYANFPFEWLFLFIGLILYGKQQVNSLREKKFVLMLYHFCFF